MNQTPEQLARDKIDRMLSSKSCQVQSKQKINLSAGKGIAVREYLTDIGPADDASFVDKKSEGIIKVKWIEEGVHLKAYMDHSEG